MILNAFGYGRKVCVGKRRFEIARSAVSEESGHRTEVTEATEGLADNGREA
jgi:hypothetical protein